MSVGGPAPGMLVHPKEMGAPRSHALGDLGNRETEAGEKQSTIL